MPTGVQAGARLEQEVDGAHTAAGECKGGSRNTNQSLEVARRGEKRFQKRGSVAKTKLKGNASAENNI